MQLVCAYFLGLCAALIAYSCIRIFIHLQCLGSMQTHMAIHAAQCPCNAWVAICYNLEGRADDVYVNWRSLSLKIGHYMYTAVKRSCQRPASHYGASCAAQLPSAPGHQLHFRGTAGLQSKGRHEIACSQGNKYGKVWAVFRDTGM